MSEGKVTAVVVTYNSARWITRALSALRRSHERGLVDCIVVDNASADDTLAVVRQEHPWARVIESGGNLGYGRGCNVGLAAATTPYVMFMNPDAAIEPDAIQCLRDTLAEYPRVGMVGPAIPMGEQLQDAGALASPGTILSQAMGRRLRARRAIRPGEPPFSTDWLSGALMVVRTEEVRGMGGFDPRFFLYFEETDLCRRMLRAGLELWAVGEAVAEHEGGGSTTQPRRDLVSGCIPQHFFRSRYYYLVKHWGRAVAIPTELLDWALTGSRWVLRRLRGRDATDLTLRLRRPIMRMPAPP